MPTRVLDVGSPDGAQPARLLVTQGRHDCYLALSHRWGPHDFVTTTKSVLESYKQSIDLTTLPKTYQDAAVVVRKLGFRFIWIDSLCIVQDDEDDWNREAKTMGLVYQNAHFTIAASHALSDHEGFLFPREIEPFVVRLPCESENPDLGNMYFRTNNVPAFGQGLAPLNQRGWVLQEYTLSRRIICFTRDQVYWHCHQYLLGEDGNKEDTSTFINTSDRLSQSLKLHRQPKIDDATGSLTSVENSRQYESSSLSAALYVFWASKIQSYSRCALTYPQDKLPAVLGLATEIQQAFNLQYIDGHWFFEHPLFTYSLLWYAEESLVRPAMTRCPSWSWAAMDGPIIFHFYSLDLEVRRKVVLNVLKVLASERFGLHPYRSLFMKGHIRAAARSTKWLRGRGSRRPSLLMNNNDNIQAPTRRCYGILNPSDPRYGLSNAQNCVGWVCFDTNAVEPETFFCIAVCEREGSAYPDYTFRDCPVIIVVSVTGGAAGCGSEYSRIGIGAVTGLDWFNDGDDDNKNNSDEVFTLI
ncbi:hypothetical protein MMC24_004246 [Lignoscripta atroalba]|nr:hypothetical protein [Lignoscripta atroalba]